MHFVMFKGLFLLLLRIYMFVLCDIIELSNERGASCMKLTNNLSIDTLMKPYEDGYFSEDKLDCIRWGLRNNFDVSIYARPEYNLWQMHQICDGLEHGRDVSLYADPRFNEHQMEMINDGLRNCIDASIYADPRFEWRQMNVILRGLLVGIDVSSYVDPTISHKEMENIRTRHLRD